MAKGSKPKMNNKVMPAFIKKMKDTKGMPKDKIPSKKKGK